MKQTTAGEGREEEPQSALFLLLLFCRGRTMVMMMMGMMTMVSKDDKVTEWRRETEMAIKIETNDCVGLSWRRAGPVQSPANIQLTRTFVLNKPKSIAMSRPSPRLRLLLSLQLVSRNWRGREWSARPFQIDFDLLNYFWQNQSCPRSNRVKTKGEREPEEVY